MRFAAAQILRDIRSWYFGFHKTIDRYIAAELLQPFFVSLAFFVTIFISIALRETLSDLIAKGIPLGTILFFLVNTAIEQMPTALPPVVLFSGLLAANRLSGDLELTAMRALGISYRRIYGNFLIVGFFLCLLMAFINFFLGPVQSRHRRAVSEWLFIYQSLAFVKPGSFFNKPVGGGDHLDIYAQSRKGSVLENVYVHRWNIDPKQESTMMRHSGKEVAVGRSQTQQIIYAQEGELIERPKTKTKAPKQHKASKDHKAPYREQSTTRAAPKLPLGLQGRSLMDLSFVNILPEIEDTRQRQKYIRLKSGFTIELTGGREQLQITEFRQGLMDYALPPSSQSYGYFAITSHILTLPQLIEIYYRLNSGGLVLDPHVIAGARKVNPQNYIELPRLELLPLLEKESLSLSELSPEDFYRKYGLYIPKSADSPEKRQAHLNYIRTLSLNLAKRQKNFLFLIHKRIASALNVLLFLFIAFPLGISVKRSGKGASFTLALIVYLLYSILGSTIKLSFEKGDLHPVWAAWLPELVILLAGLMILARLKESRGLRAWLFARVRS